jgi:hypothetical protein
MKTYTTLDAIGDMFVIYGIVIVISMLVAGGHSRHRLVLSRQAETGSRQSPGQAGARSPNRQQSVGGVPQEHLAVIAAAVAAMMGAHRIVHIETPDRGFGWTAEARSVHHTSHAPRASH